MTSRRGVGYNWIQSDPNDKIQLFGAGGHYDGTPVSIINGANRAKNKQAEEALSMQGMGQEGSIDVADPINNFNTNNEFNFSSYKRGDTQRGDFYISFGQELSSGDVDTNLLNPYATSMKETAQALGIESERAWGTIDYGDEPLLQMEGQNPFMGVLPVKETETQQEMDSSMQHYEGGGDGDIRDQFVPDNVNQQTGLRKLGIHKNSSMLKNRLEQKKSMVETYNEVYSNYREMNFGGKEAVEKYKQDRVEQLSKTRFDGSSMIASQVGLNKFSHMKSRAKKKDNVNYFSNTLIGA